MQRTLWWDTCAERARFWFQRCRHCTLCLTFICTLLDLASIQLMFVQSWYSSNIHDTIIWCSHEVLFCQLLELAWSGALGMEHPRKEVSFCWHGWQVLGHVCGSLCCPSSSDKNLSPLEPDGGLRSEKTFAPGGGVQGRSPYLDRYIFNPILVSLQCMAEGVSGDFFLNVLKSGTVGDQRTHMGTSTQQSTTSSVVLVTIDLLLACTPGVLAHPTPKFC